MEILNEYVNWREATINDVEDLTNIFWDNLILSPQYISHGEMQMGIVDYKGELTPNGKEKWGKYITRKIEEKDAQLPSNVIIRELENKITAFGVFFITEDEDKPFGVICDMWVDNDFRGRGLGKEILNIAYNWFNKYSVKDIYLESGLNNHSAHNFFKNNNFEPISCIFKLKREN